MISALNVVMQTIINPAGGDIKNVHCQNDLPDTGAVQLRARVRAAMRAATRVPISDARGALGVHHIRPR